MQFKADIMKESMAVKSYVSTEVKSRQDVGILIREVFPPLHTADFIRLACPPPPDFMPEHLPHTWVKWRDPASHSGDGMPLTYGRYDGIHSRSLHLFAFGEAVRLNFPLSDLEFPVAVAGCAWILNTVKLLEWRQNNPETYSKLKEAGSITWTRDQKLTFLFAATEHDSSQMSESEIRETFGLQQEVPIVLCPAGFDLERVELILATLVQQIDKKNAR